jgi:predicted DCC family thiol-disulfide oxidoreductase YuxK
MVGPVRAPLILFDGVCNLCNAWVRFVIRRDPTGVFRFAAQQSPIGLSRRYPLPDCAESCARSGKVSLVFAPYTWQLSLG